MPIILSSDGVNRQAKSVPLSVNGANVNAKSAWAGVGGVNQRVLSSELIASAVISPMSIYVNNDQVWAISKNSSYPHSFTRNSFHGPSESNETISTSGDRTYHESCTGLRLKFTETISFTNFGGRKIIEATLTPDSGTSSRVSLSSTKIVFGVWHNLGSRNSGDMINRYNETNGTRLTSIGNKAYFAEGYVYAGCPNVTQPDAGYDLCAFALLGTSENKRQSIRFTVSDIKLFCDQYPSGVDLHFQG